MERTRVVAMAPLGPLVGVTVPAAHAQVNLEPETHFGCYIASEELVGDLAFPQNLNTHEGVTSGIENPESHLTCHEIHSLQRAKPTGFGIRKQVRIRRAAGRRGGGSWLCLRGRVSPLPRRNLRSKRG